MPLYDQEALQKFRLSGKILKETREEMCSYVHENMLIIDVCEHAEGLIRQKGGQPAFPVNVSINEVTAHYTSPPGDKKTIPPNSVVKVDLGVHVDGYVTDTAFTACFNPEYTTMVQTAEIALKAAIEQVHGDVSPSRIGATVEDTIKNRGFKVISNLTGHSVGRYLIHAGTSIPNVHQVTIGKLHAGEVYALEPFVTTPDAAGYIEDTPIKTIFRLVKTKSAKTPEAKQLLKYIDENFHTLPFTERWIQNVVPKAKYTEAFKELLKTKSITAYPVFEEVTKKVVAQAEHTILVTEKGCDVLT
jgi:methionyl aminopeptidase